MVREEMFFPLLVDCSYQRQRLKWSLCQVSTSSPCEYTIVELGGETSTWGTFIRPARKFNTVVAALPYLGWTAPVIC